jgi:hypothetical protein
MRSVSKIMAGEPLAAPGAVTVIVSTYTPGARPAAERVQPTVPEPVPPAVVSVFQLRLLLALHAVDDAPVPESKTLALSPGAPAPCWTTTVRAAGLTASDTGSTDAVIRNVS